MASLAVQGDDASTVPLISAAFAVAAALVVLITRRHGTGRQTSTEARTS
jgi:hypothetical protein